MNDLYDNFNRIENNFPDFFELFRDFALGEVFDNSNLNQKDSLLVTLATLIANQSPKAFKKILINALDMDVTPVEVVEVLYQSVPYVGFAKAHNFFGVVIKAFTKKGIALPLQSQTTVTEDNRYEKGRELQEKYFGSEMIQMMNDNAPEGQKHFNRFLEGYCFGDFYTRNGLNDQQRELITFVFIASLGGCENQLKGHIQGNLNVGHNKEKLISALTVILPYIGFPRTLNALHILNEVCD